MWGRGRAHSIARPSVPLAIDALSISYHFVIFSWLQKSFHPSDPDTMTNTAIEATASSIGKNVRKPYVNLNCEYIVTVNRNPCHSTLCALGTTVLAASCWVEYFSRSRDMGVIWASMYDSPHKPSFHKVVDHLHGLHTVIVLHLL